MPQPSSLDLETTSLQASSRVMSLDVYRGLIMVSLLYAGFGLSETANLHLQQAGSTQAAAVLAVNDPSEQVAKVSGDWWWQIIRYQFSHCEWVGCTYWDLVQPAFMFMVGTAMAYSLLKRKAVGDSYNSLLAHTLRRSVILILMGIFLKSNWSHTTNWSFMNVLTQMGLAYPFLFLLWGKSFQTQVIVATVVLIATWLLYATYSHSGIDFEAGAPEVGVSAAWAQENLKGVGAAWQKNANVGQAIDLWLLNQFPRPERFAYNSGGYQTLNFLPSLVGMLFGLMAGELLRSKRPQKEKLRILILSGIAGIVLGQLLHSTGICPVVKRICTPSFILFSSGWCSIILGVLYGLVDMLKIRFWTFPFTVVGRNSIAAYWMHMLLGAWIARSLTTHFGAGVFHLQLTWGDHCWRLFGESSDSTLALYEPFIREMLVGTMMWGICWWMYRQKLFIRI